ncbi:hypothetical protein BKA67DRAFT_558584 [Truncatella angustata]|uniref:Uncharacterized protein n=1 Tax=Truncatella angustata TaxID=152316 RepID=A0A9P9A2W2_9PEZI|nr:uncharacterized protein BKA67DRAFT_558584 [Truncatella angustata]KAH6658626.1 hypothetical protein BKA67DRAFT_558584 [Truncatella angustata]
MDSLGRVSANRPTLSDSQKRQCPESFRFCNLPPEIRHMVYKIVSETSKAPIQLRYMGPKRFPGAPRWLRTRKPRITGLMCVVLVNWFIYAEFFPYYQSYATRSTHMVDLEDIGLYLTNPNVSRNLIVTINPWASHDEMVDLLPLLQHKWGAPESSLSFAITKVWAQSSYKAGLGHIARDLNLLLSYDQILKLQVQKGALDGIEVCWRSYSVIFVIFIRKGHTGSKQRYEQSLSTDLAEELGILSLREIEWRVTSLSPGLLEHAEEL